MQKRQDEGGGMVGEMGGDAALGKTGAPRCCSDRAAVSRAWMEDRSEADSSGRRDMVAGADGLQSRKGSARRILWTAGGRCTVALRRCPINAGQRVDQLMRR